MNVNNTCALKLLDNQGIKNQSFQMVILQWSLEWNSNLILKPLHMHVSFKKHQKQ